MMSKKLQQKAFTMVELLMVVGIIAIIGFVAIPNFLKFRNHKSLELAASELLNYLRDVQQKAVSQEESASWGIYLDAVGEGGDYYLVFYGDNYSEAKNASQLRDVVYLPAGVQFLSPIQGTNTEITFLKMNGRPSVSTNINLCLIEDFSVCKTLHVNLNGTVAIKDYPFVEEIVSSIKQTGGDFSSLAAWQEAYGGIDFGSCAQGDLVCLDKIVVAEIDGVWTAYDELPVTIDGWNTDAQHYVKIYTTPIARHNGVWDNSKYVLESVSSFDNSTLTIRSNFVLIEGLTVKSIGTSGSWHVAIDVRPRSSDSEIQIADNLIKGYFSGSASYAFGIKLGDSRNYPGVFKVWNNIVYDFKGGSQNMMVGIFLYRYPGTKAYIYNNTIRDDKYGIYVDHSYESTVVLKNNLSYKNTTKDYDLDVPVEIAVNNLSGDNSSPNSLFRNKTVKFVAESSDNFHILASDTSAKNQGVDLSQDPYLNFGTDIDGQPRFGNWDIGADEYQ